MKVFLKHEKAREFGVPHNLSEGTTYLVHHILQTNNRENVKLLISNDNNELVLVDYDIFRTPPDLAKFNEE